MVRLLARVVGIGIETADMLVERFRVIDMLYKDGAIMQHVV
jgi:hypothetical protein